MVLSQLLTWFVGNVFARIFVRQVFVHVLVGHAQRVVQHGQLFHGIRSFKHRFDFGLHIGLGREIDLRNDRQTKKSETFATGTKIR